MDIAARMNRYRAFYASPRGGLMAHVSYPRAAEPVELVPLTAVNWSDEASIRAFALQRVQLVKRGARAMDLDDDAIPGIQVLAGTGMVAAAYVQDAVLHQESNTNYIDPPIQSWTDGLDRIGFNPANPWFQAQVTILRTYVQEWNGDFGITPFTHFDPLDLANQLRGNDLFYDLQDEPAGLRRLLKRCADSILALETRVREDGLKGYGWPGACVGGCWIPAGNYLSCDAGDLMSAPALAEWGLPFTQRICEAWGGAFLHHHELGMHQIPTWSNCRRLTVQFCNLDPNTRHLGAPGAIDDRIIESTSRVPLSFICSGAEFLQSAHRWREGRFIVSVRCDSEAQARRIVKRMDTLRNS